MNAIKAEKLLDQGSCLNELRRAGMPQWGTSPFVMYDQPQSSSFVKNEDQVEVDQNEDVKPHLTPYTTKRKRIPKCKASPEQMKRPEQTKLDKPRDRWSTERYNIAEEKMFQVMKAEGAVFDNRITRPALRMAARKLIGDTGLLDHLLKHIDGRVASGGEERFRRCYNSVGVMEYWLESANLINHHQDSANADQVKLLKAEMDTIKRDLQEVIYKKQEQEKSNPVEVEFLKAEMDKMKRDMEELISNQNKSNQVEEMHKELAEWKSMTDKHVMDVSKTLSGVQDMNREWITWKAKIEQQLMEISSSMSSRKSSKQCTTTFSPSPSDSWEDWLESTNIQGGDLVSWLGSTDLVNVGQEAIMQDVLPASLPWLQPLESPSQDPFCAGGQEIAETKRDVPELLPGRQEEDQATVTPDSSVTGNSKSDVDNSLLLFQEMFKELAKWKAKIEQQMMEISKAVRAMEASQPFTVDFNF